LSHLIGSCIVKLTPSFAATLEQRLLEQQQNGTVPNVQCINLMEGPTIDTVLDVDQPTAHSTAPSSLSDSNSETHPMLQRISSDAIIAKSLESPTSIYISDLLRADLLVLQRCSNACD